jgi:hypothetical protein
MVSPEHCVDRRCVVVQCGYVVLNELLNSSSMLNYCQRAYFAFLYVCLLLFCPALVFEVNACLPVVITAIQAI